MPQTLLVVCCERYYHTARSKNIRDRPRAIDGRPAYAEQQLPLLQGCQQKETAAFYPMRENCTLRNTVSAGDGVMGHLETCNLPDGPVLTDAWAGQHFFI